MRALALALAALLALAACGKEGEVAEKPAPREVTDASIGHYCGMALAEHEGPKAQIFLTDRKDPVWFSSVRDAFAFTMLPEEPKSIAAIYVNDMGRATNWEQPEPGTWIDARTAFFVIGSERRAGMGGDEAVPFGSEAEARRFAATNGGQVVRFADVPESYVFPGGGAGRTPQAASAPAANAETDHAPGH